MDEWTSLHDLGFSKYEANRTGDVRHKRNKRILKRKEQKSEHIKISISHDDGSNKNVRADKLICATFIGPPPSESYRVVHINGDMSDSRVENLKWATIKEKFHADTKPFRTKEYISILTLQGEELRDCGPYGYIDYLASSFGRIYSMRSGKILSGTLRVDGYMQVSVVVGDHTKSVAIHVIICHAFNGNPPDPTYTVDHIDRNKANNKSLNLRWASKSEQSINKDKESISESLVAQIKDSKIIEFYTKENILEIFDLDQVDIPDEGLYHNEYLATRQAKLVSCARLDL